MGIIPQFGHEHEAESYFLKKLISEACLAPLLDLIGDSFSGLSV